VLRRLVLLLFFCIPFVSRAQIITGNAYVEADVAKDGSGFSVCYFGGTGHLQALTSPSLSSFVTFSVDGNFYTNNTHLTNSNGVTVMRNGKTVKNGDTIETVWSEGTGAFDLVQDIYPVVFPIEGSGQIVFKFSIRNHENSFLSAQSQYLLDVAFTDYGHPSNDNPPVTTRYGYMDTGWVTFPDSTNTPIPTYFISSMLPTDSVNFPLLLGVGYLSDSLAPEPMGITIPPWRVSYVDWREVSSGWTWGSPTKPVQNPLVGDAALLVQWPASRADAGTTIELGRFSYGTAPCLPASKTFGELMLHPDHIAWNPNTKVYSPDRFPVDAVFWNIGTRPQDSSIAIQSVVYGSSSVEGGPVTIVSPKPVTNNGYSQRQNLVGKPVADRPFSSVSWVDTVLQNYLANCLTDSSYDIQLFGGRSGGSGQAYSCPIAIDCQEKDLTPPRHSTHLIVGPPNHCGNYITQTDSVYDNLSTDLGLQSIDWAAEPNNNMVSVTIGQFSSCTNGSVPITVTQLDTIHPECVYFAFIDCAGNVSYDTICFGFCASEFYDTLPPRFRLLKEYDWNAAAQPTCGFKCSEWVMTDSVMDGFQEDEGFQAVTIVDSTNMRFTLSQPDTFGMKVDTFTTCVIDSMKSGSISISIVDVPGNVAFKTITYCPSSEAVSLIATQTISISVFPSPLESVTTVLLSGASSADVEVFDVLGREVGRFHVEGSYDWQTSELSPGTYILRASSDGQLFSKRIIKR